LNEIAELLRATLSGGSMMALPLAVVGGVVTGLNPCCLPLYPAAAATCCAIREERTGLSLLGVLAFLVGVALTTALLGVAAALAGRILVGATGWTAYAVALVPLVMGAHLLGWIHVSMPTGLRIGRYGGAFGAFLAGVLMWLVFAPCSTPVLASVLSYAAYEGNPSYGAALLFLYGIGAGLPVIGLGGSFGTLTRRLDRHGWRERVDWVTGAALLGVGFYIVWVA
jgi:cytochrome c biogenesis protein CcdA